MKFKKNKITFHDGTHGICIIAPKVSHYSELIDWIEKKYFTGQETKNNRLAKHTRKRNKLYSFEHTILRTEVILKTSKVDKQYKFFRRLNLYISIFFNDYNLRAFKGACILKDKGFSCATPIAYWQELEGFFNRKSYYLYEKIHADDSVYSFSQKLNSLNLTSSSELFDELACKVASIVRKIHDAGYRQGDPHPGNFLLSLNHKNNNELDRSSIKNSKIYIIDLDKFNQPIYCGALIKRFFDLKCMRRCTLGPFNQDDMLKYYLQSEYSKFWSMVLKFWINGGFNIIKWVKAAKPGR